jgi:hypothetical protein
VFHSFVLFLLFHPFFHCPPLYWRREGESKREIHQLMQKHPGAQEGEINNNLLGAALFFIALHIPLLIKLF